jgi:5'-3' exonuclease
MLALIDADLIAYEAASAAEMVEEGYERRSFDYVIEHINRSIAFITEQAGCESYELFITGKENFRYDIATVKPYKGNRSDKPKPFYLEATRKLLESYGAIVCDYMEADDMLAVRAKDFHEDEVCICSRDKDLRMVPVWQYSWEVGNQPEWGPMLVDRIGELQFRFSDKILKNGEKSNAIKKVTGTGLKWFYAQVITGDSTDNIPGLEGKGGGLVHQILEPCTTEQELFTAVCHAYQARYGETYPERLLEQCRLLWMHDTLDDNGRVVLWEFPYDLA